MTNNVEKVQSAAIVGAEQAEVAETATPNAANAENKKTMSEENLNNQIEVKDSEEVNVATAAEEKVNEVETVSTETPNNDDEQPSVDSTAKSSTATATSATAKKSSKKISELPPSPEQIEALKKETEVFEEEIKRILADPKYHATKSASGRCYMDLTAAHNEGVKIYVLNYNRIHGRDEKTTGASLYNDGAQQILLIAPVRVTKVAGLPVSHFRYDPDQDSPIDEDGIAILDGSGRTNHAFGCGRVWPQLDAAFVTKNGQNYIDTKKVYAVTNENIMTWGAKDHLIPRLFDPYELRRETFQKIHNLEGEGRKYTAACEWVTWNKGNITITKLNERVTKEEADRFSENSKFGERIYNACVAKFKDSSDSSFLNTKKFPEWLIDRWTEWMRDGGTDRATDIMVEFINQLTSEQIVKICTAKRDPVKLLDKDTVRLQIVQEIYSKFEATKKAGK